MSGDTIEESLAGRAGRLFDAYRCGDESTMGELVRLLTPILWHTVRATRLDAASSEDVLQTVWLTLVRKADTIAEPQAVLQWLVVTTKRESWRVSKLSARTRPEDMEATGSADRESSARTDEEVLQHDTDDRLWRHVHALPERCQSLLRVIAFADKPDYADLARSLGMKQGSIGPTRGRCLAKLKVLLDQDPEWGG